MNIKDVSKLVGMNSSKIRFYESIGLITPNRTENNYRVYTEQDIFILKSIVVLQYSDFDLQSISKIMKSLYADASEDCNTAVNNLFKNKILELEKRIQLYQLIIELLQSVPLAESSAFFHQHREDFLQTITSIINKVYDDIEEDL